MIIYKTIFPNGKIYIGQDRYNNCKYFGSGVKCLDAIKKFGINNLKKEVLRLCKNQKELDKWEMIYIKKFDSTNPKIGYNILPGTANEFGSGSPMLIKEVRDKYIETCSNRSSEERLRIKNHYSRIKKEFYKNNPDKIPRGRNNGMFNKKHSEETKKIISIKTKNKLSEKEIRNKISNKSKDMWDNFKKNGIHLDIIKKRAESKKRGVIQLDLDDNFIREFNGAIDVQNELGFCRMNIGKCCRDNKIKLKHSRYGYKWIFKNG